MPCLFYMNLKKLFNRTINWNEKINERNKKNGVENVINSEFQLFSIFLKL